MKTALIAALALLLISLSESANAASPEDEQLYSMQSLMVVMRDSVGLSTDVYLPSEEGPHPVILMRLPYGTEGREWLADALAPHGYAVVVQNVRGTNGSGGEFVPFLHEQADGVATVAWILKQGWCDGRIGLWGPSYAGYCSFAIAAANLPGVVSMMHISGWPDLGHFLAEDGAFRLMAHLRWFYTYASGQPEPPEEAWDSIFRTVPTAQFFGAAGQAIAGMAAGGYPYERLSLPILHVTGWNDYIYPMVLDAYENIKARSPAADQQVLLVGPWVHNDFLNGGTSAGDEEFGPEAAYGLDRAMELTVEWFDATMRGDSEKLSLKSPVRVFVTGANEWRDFGSWPPASESLVSRYLDSDGHANTGSGSGRLLASADVASGADSFVYDPNDPVPTVGGPLFHFFRGLLGPRDQSDIESREDVLVYTSEPLPHDMELIGPVEAVIYASTEGADTDFTAKLVSVAPDGYARYVADGIVRGRHLFGPIEDDRFLEPGEVYRFDIDLSGVAHVVPAGYRLRLDVSSSNFPRFDRNPNTGIDPFQATEFRPVRQEVYHGGEYPSRVVLPVVDDVGSG
jgi:predicted acyl esterase